MDNIENVKDGKMRMIINIYGDNCWMGYQVSKSNPYTFHHIRKKNSGGKRVIGNGALLTKYAHTDLNRIEKLLPLYYDELNILFKELNKTNKPPTIEYYQEINEILKIVSKKLELSQFFVPNREIKIYYPEDYEIEYEPELIHKVKTKMILNNN